MLSDEIYSWIRLSGFASVPALNPAWKAFLILASFSEMGIHRAPFLSAVAFFESLMPGGWILCEFGRRRRVRALHFSVELFKHLAVGCGGCMDCLGLFDCFVHLIHHGLNSLARTDDNHHVQRGLVGKTKCVERASRGAHLTECLFEFGYGVADDSFRQQCFYSKRRGAWAWSATVGG